MEKEPTTKKVLLPSFSPPPKKRMGEQQTPNTYPEMLSHYPIKLNLQNMLLYPKGRGCTFL